MLVWLRKNWISRPLLLTGLCVSAQAQTGGVADVNYDDPNMARSNTYVTDSNDDELKAPITSEANYLIQSAAYEAVDYASSGGYGGSEDLIHPDQRLPASNATAVLPSAVK